MPSSALPFAYFVFAHACLAAALLVLIAQPALPGGFFYHPRLIALVHLVTLGWISGSILGAFYIVAPLALATPLPAGPRDWAGFALFSLGTLGMVSHFWIGTYDGMAWSAALVIAAVAHLAWRAMRGLTPGAVPWPIVLHVRLAFVNFGAAAALGVMIGIDRAHGVFGLPPIMATYAHAHLAALGWAAMMVIGLAYRLVPMLLPSAMASGSALAASAILLEAGLAVLAGALLFQWPVLPAAAALIVAALAMFAVRLIAAARRRMPRPPALPRRDWSVMHVGLSFLWLFAAAILGVVLSISPYGAAHDRMAWVYGVAGLVGFLAQIVAGMQGRIVPYYAWYRAMAARGGAPPGVSANALPAAAIAGAVFSTWLAGVPLLAWALPAQHHAAIRASALLLLAGVVLQMTHLVYMLYRAGTPAHAHPAIRRPDRS
jgi:hypothetical protein